MKRIYESEDFEADLRSDDNDLEEEVPDWVPHYFTVTGCTEREIQGWVGSEQDLDRLLEAHKQAQQCSFAKRTNDALMRERRDNRMKWSTAIGGLGIPCIITKVAHKTCRYGGQRKSNPSKAKMRPEDRGFTKAGKLKNCRQSKKVGCPAQINIYHGIYYDEYKCGPSRRARAKKMAELKERCKSSNKPLGVTRIRVVLPRETAHEGHAMATTNTSTSTISPLVQSKIYEFIGQGITSADVIAGLLLIDGPRSDAVDQQEGVQNDVNNHEADSQCDPESAIAKPLADEKDIRMCIHTALCLGYYKNFDQSDLRTFLATIATDDTRVHLRLAKTIRQTTFLFVHQEKWQRDILARYRDGMFLLDAVHNATQCAMPLYQIIAQTNCGYVPVAEFVTENEEMESVAEALRIVRDWNPEWQPRHFVADVSKPEVEALTSELGVDVFHHRAHCEQAWRRWAADEGSGLSQPEQRELLAMLSRISHAMTREEYDGSISALVSSALYSQHEKVRQFLTQHWFCDMKRWCDVFVPDGFQARVTTSHGVETLQLTLKHWHFQLSGITTLSKLVRQLILDFIPSQKYRYSQSQAEPSFADPRYKRGLPVWLHNRPTVFVKETMQSLEASNEITDSDIIIREDGAYVINDAAVHCGSTTTMPACSCLHFRRTFYPCAHLLALLRKLGKSFPDLYHQYRDSAFTTLDPAFILQASSHKQVDDPSAIESANEDTDETDDCEFEPTNCLPGSVKNKKGRKTVAKRDSKPSEKDLNAFSRRILKLINLSRRCMSTKALAKATMKLLTIRQCLEKFTKNEECNSSSIASKRLLNTAKKTKFKARNKKVNRRVDKISQMKTLNDQKIQGAEFEVKLNLAAERNDDFIGQSVGQVTDHVIRSPPVGKYLPADNQHQTQEGLELSADPCTSSSLPTLYTSQTDISGFAPVIHQSLKTDPHHQQRQATFATNQQTTGGQEDAQQSIINQSHIIPSVTEIQTPVESDLSTGLVVKHIGPSANTNAASSAIQTSGILSNAEFVGSSVASTVLQSASNTGLITVGNTELRVLANNELLAFTASAPNVATQEMSSVRSNEISLLPASVRTEFTPLQVAGIPSLPLASHDISLIASREIQAYCIRELGSDPRLQEFPTVTITTNRDLAMIGQKEEVPVNHPEMHNIISHQLINPRSDVKSMPRPETHFMTQRPVSGNEMPPIDLSTGGLDSAIPTGGNRQNLRAPPNTTAPFFDILR